MVGKLYGIGVGPGDPELLTLKARRIIEEVPVLAVPVSQRGEESLALKVVKPFIRPQQEILSLFMPMSRDRSYLERSWEAAAHELLNKLYEGKDVAFLTLGDASLYSTYSYLMEKAREMNPDLVVETVPGITSFCAAAARLNLPLAKGDEPLAIIPVVEEDVATLREWLAQFPNLVLMKVARRYEEIVGLLAEAGVLKSSVLATRCCLEGERFSWDLEAGLGQRHDYLSLILVHKGRSSG
ncbi:precorrin-2 C20-methyltransferase /cobalt-factor II C20-methyltransferase [Thermanaeromonas toyohensis ToBE]|uniref:Precorrin-2 C20-methyltransferase /cobalt-factor II C20-methyltransferase n=1 Tax=Thermanaeromonas toyohensis ToBE TaxID=698762 RepID=A0A1W1VVP1_9FIRM|nr:precorrin-2 C(20)-methyltransferase [Thermanaeromonas toyohensis]SMB97323.1 precorrin-2 C20-methyltransferase /cobalt-factor II C20-methyltransferase [Thermanaeromonas toyohensis ToBE]